MIHRDSECWSVMRSESNPGKPLHKQVLNQSSHLNQVVACKRRRISGRGSFPREATTGNTYRPEITSYEMASKANNQQLLDELEQNIVICWWRADQLRLRQIIDPRDTDKSRYFAITEFNNCFIIRSPSLFFNYLRIDLPFSHAKAIAGRRKA